MYDEYIKKSKKYFGVVYMLTNIKTSMIYIGQTTNLQQRLRQYRYESLKLVNATRQIGRAIYEYKFDNFKLDILKYCDSIETMNYYEKLYIEKFNTIYPNGYNTRSGGDSYTRQTNIAVWTDERRKSSSNTIVSYKNGIFKKYYSGKIFADFIGVERTHVTRAAKHGIKVKDYFVFYYNTDKLSDIILDIENEISVRKERFNMTIKSKDEYLMLAKKVKDRSVEIIEPYIIEI